MKRRSDVKILTVGLTGGFATGKSAVSGVFRKLGACVIDFDRLARQALEKGSPVYRKAVEAFGAGAVLARSGEIDRRKVAEIIFSDAKKRKKLEAFVHPFVFQRAEEALGKCRKRIAVLEVPLLFETGFDKRVDVTVVVTCSLKRQVARAMRKHGLSKSEVLRRIKAQMKLAEKERRADFVILNEGELEGTAKKIKVVWTSLERLCAGGKNKSNKGV